MEFGAVAIGRNEGERLMTCLKSLSAAATVIYVDSGSTDGSAARARNQGANVIELDMSIAFTAARARNAGFRHLRKMAPDLSFVQFIDGDCELIADWPAKGLALLYSRERSASWWGACASATPNGRSTTGCARGSGMGRLVNCGHAAASR